MPVPSDLTQVLLIAYLYPPVSNTGTRRITRYTRFLPESGYRPLVLTTNTRGALPDDAVTLTFRAGELLGSAKRLYRSLRLKNVPAERQAGVTLVPQNRAAKWLQRFIIPDMQVTWYPQAVRLGCQILLQQPVRLIFSTSGPETGHLIALRLKQQTGLPWVADFRDGWMFEPLIEARQTFRLRRWLELRLERAVVRHADRLVVINEVMAEDLRARYPEAAGKVVVIPLGFDADDFTGLERQPADPDRLRIIHTGSFSLSEKGRSIDGLLSALQALKAEGSDAARCIELVLIGNMTPAEREAFAASGVQDCLRLVGTLPHRDSLQQQVDADALLLVTHPEKLTVFTGKLFEYLAAGRPILALTPPQSAAGRLITSLDAGIVVPPDDADGIRAALLSLYARWRAGDLPVRQDERVKQFEYRELTRRLADVFDEVIDAPRRR